MVNEPNYNIILIGGGIGGLFLGVYFTKTCNIKKVLIIEKEPRLGGKVKSIFPGNGVEFEAGAGRISANHKKIMKLLSSYGLYKNLKKIDNNFEYLDVKKHQTCSFHFISKKMFAIFAKLYIKSVFYSKDYLLTKTFKQFAEEVLSTSEIKDIITYFPYYSEFYIENAYEGINSIRELSHKNTFFTLEGGLSTIIDALKKDFIKNGGEILHSELKDINVVKKNNIRCITANSKHPKITKCLVLCMNSDDIMKIPMFSKSKCTVGKKMPIFRYLDQVKCLPILRIYAIYPMNEDGKVWFHDMPRIVTNSKFRLLIPIDYQKGIIMVSYVDGFYTLYWKDKLKNQAKLALTIEKLFNEMFPKKNIPKAKFIGSYYWSRGTCYLRPNSDRLDQKIIAEKMYEPFENENIFISSNSFSAQRNWMEGSLDSAQKVVQRMISRKKKNH